MRRQKIEDLIWEKVDTSGGENACWEWTGYKSHGYGLVHIDGRTIRAHRLVFETLVQGIPDGMMVCHHCDNPSCCNPAHLFLGDALDNCRDMIRKRRAVWKSEKFTAIPQTDWSDFELVPPAVRDSEDLVFG